VLSPLAKTRGWAPGPTGDWAEGSKGWIVWISLAIMLADSLVNLAWLVLRPLARFMVKNMPAWRDLANSGKWKELFKSPFSQATQYAPLGNGGRSSPHASEYSHEDTTPANHLISNRVTIIGLVLSCLVCIGGVHYTFGHLIPLGLTILSLVFAMLLSVMGVRALGETDLNPVSGISKLTQLVFALFTSRDNKNAVVINLIAGALSESGALQAGDLMQDLKTGHLLGASPVAQFYGQIIGSAVGAVVSAVVYKLYTNVYDIPGNPFVVPTAYVWVYTARLVTGQGLPKKVPEWAVGAALVFACTTILRIWLNAGSQSMRRIANWIPGGIAVAVGMYNTPSFTIARAAGGLLSWYWHHYKGRPETPLIVLASGLILGEGLFSIVNLGLASIKVPHL